MKKVLIFDFDGVIVDSSSKAFELIQRAYPGTTRGSFEALFSGNVFQELEKLGKPLISMEEMLQEWKSIIQFSSGAPEMVGGMREMILSLEKGHLLLAVNTASEADIVKSFFQKQSIEGFQIIYGSETSRSKVEKFKLIFERLSCQPGDCIFVTDTVGDVKESLEVAVPAIFVTWGYQSRETLEGSGVSVLEVADSPDELKLLLERLI